MFGDCSDICQDADKIMVAVPARDDVKVQMIGNPCSGSSSNIAADIESVWLKVIFDNSRCCFDSFHQGAIFNRGQFGDTWQVTDWCHQQVTVGVGKTIEQYNRMAVPIKE